MIKSKHQKWMLIIGLALTILFIHLPVVFTYFYHDVTNMPKAMNGNMDLSFVNKENKKIYLDGQWEFYWKRFIVSEPEQNDKPDLIMAVPDEWSRYKISEESLPAGGFGSYRITLTGFDYENCAALYIPDYGGAYRVFIDRQLAAESGTVSKDAGEIFTVPQANLYPVKFTEDTKHEVVIEVATTRFSGLYMTPVLSDYYQTISENNFRDAFRFILFGIALFSFLSLIITYILCVRKKLNFFWTPIMILFILIRIMLTTEFYSFFQPILFFNLSYESANELMYFATFVLKYLLIFLVQEQCGIKFTKREKAAFFIYYFLLYIIYLLVPQSIYNQYLSVYVPMLTYVLDVYLFIKIYLGRKNLKKFGMMVFWLMTLIIAGLAIDSYYINGKIYMNMSLTMLLLFTLAELIMSCVYAMRTIDLYDDFATSSSKLELLNSQVEMQKEYYNTLSGQINEIREVKHDIRHFIGAISVLADDGKLDELKLFLREYNEKTEMQQLPVFCENIIANSIIGYYYMIAKKNGIHFESQCNIKKHVAMSDSDICIVLGNALENAIDACKQIDNSKIRFVSVNSVKMKGQWLTKIRNSYNGRLKIIDECFVSTKDGKYHGLGIRNIEKVIESYGGFVKIEYDEKEFTMMVAVPEE